MWIYGARNSEWHWHLLGYVHVCTSSQKTTPTSHHSVFLQAGCPSCHPTNSIKALIIQFLPITHHVTLYTEGSDSCF